jgi:signal transduction histidine kinase
VSPGAALQGQLDALIVHQADHIRSSAQNRVWLFIGLALVAVGLAVGLVTRASRSITQPLRSLAEQANAMATETLPTAVQSILDTPVGQDVVVPTVAPLKVRSRDEVAAVATALNTVQDRAVHLAVEQTVLRRNIADSFVNLGRRNQNLLGRQLDFISSLEQKETEPDKLDDLFRLDHLATRMRRNAESLLVLAGLESPRQWSAPVAVGDVLRASLAEVEDYRRVSVRHVDPARLTGSMAADVAHIVAELVENALAASPPNAPVELFGRAGAQEYAIVVVDRGVGMSSENLQLANRRLGGAESFTVAPSRYLGHYVAGHLAARYGITVALQESDFGGIKAKVGLPNAVLEGAPSSSPDVTPTVPVAPVRPPIGGNGNGRRPVPAGSRVGVAEPAFAPPVPRPVTPFGVPAGNVSAPSADGPVLRAPAGNVSTPRTGGPVFRAPAALRHDGPVFGPPGGPTTDRPVYGAPAGNVSVPRADGPLFAAPASHGFGPRGEALDASDNGATTTAAGLRRRVPGASLPAVADDGLLRRRSDDAPSGNESTHEVYRMLSDLVAHPPKDSTADSSGPARPKGSV